MASSEKKLKYKRIEAINKKETLFIIIKFVLIFPFFSSIGFILLTFWTRYGHGDGNDDANGDDDGDAKIW